MNPSSCRSNSPSSYVSSSSEDDQYGINESKNNTEGIKQRSKIPQVDPSVLTELEEQARYTSRSLSNLMSYLVKELKEITNATKETVCVYDKTIEHTQREVEKNIRSMYGLIAKCEELDHKMKPVNELASQVHDLNEMLSQLEEICI